MREPPRILIVDDVPANVHILQSRLAAHGYDIVTATDGEAALAAVTETQPDLILLDRRLARGAEGELIDCIRARVRLHEVPIVLYTVHGSDSAEAPPLEALRDAFDAELLLAIVEAVCASVP